MANQHLVNALVERDAAPRLRRELIDELEIPADDIAITDAPPARYRDEGPDLQLHHYVKGGSRRTIVGAIAGAVFALLLVLLIPQLRGWLPWSLILLFGGAWGGGIVATAGFMQAHESESDLGEEVHEVTPAEAGHLRLLRVTIDGDRDRVVDLLEARGATLLDSLHPKVGRGDDARPDRSDRITDAEGPPGQPDDRPPPDIR